MAVSDPFGLVGQVLDGQFRVDAPIGEGGFSVVYRGVHVGLSEPIAIKCLKVPASLGSALVESFIRRFRDESRIHYRLSQGNLHIVRSIASGTTLAPATSALVPYTVLEWLEGRSLAEEFNARREEGKTGRPLKEVVALLDSAIEAVAHAHAQGVVHRDLNPGNFFLAQTPVGVRVKILDFGVAKVMTDSALAMGPIARTVGNVRMFAPAYGAPEQFDDPTAVGPWTDVYTIALVLLEAMTDRTVMEGDHLGEYVIKAMDPNRPTPRRLGVDVGDETEKVFAQAVAVDPNLRPRDAGDFWGALKHAMQVDGRASARSSARKALAEDGVPSTLRMDRDVASMAVTGGTLRMGPGAPRSASEWLKATPLPGAAATGASSSAPPGQGASPLPPELQATMPAMGRSASVSATLIGSGPPAPMGSGPAAAPVRPPGPPLVHAPAAAFAAFGNSSPVAPSPVPPPPQYPGPTGAVPTGAMPPSPTATGIVRMTPPPPRPEFAQVTVRKERGSSAPVVLGVALAIVVVAGAAAAGWRYMHPQPPAPAPAAQP